MAAGRPSEYDPAYCERIIELGKQGASVVEMACAIGVHRETIEENWPAAHPEFSEAFTRARQESQTWWEKKGRDNLTTPGFQASVWSRSMAARFPKDWREKQAHVGGDENDPPIRTKNDTLVKVEGLNDEQLRALASIPIPQG